jgi:hypothetical protein
MTVAKPKRRKPGRPRKYGEGRINATVRFTPKAYDALKTAADDNRRSVSEEVERRIERSLAEERVAHIQRGIAQVAKDLQEIAQELLDKAGACIQRLEAAQAHNEEAIERAVARALAKAGLIIGGEDL